MHKPDVELAKLKKYHKSKIVKAGPMYDVRPEHPPVQINSSSPCLDQYEF